LTLPPTWRCWIVRAEAAVAAADVALLDHQSRGGGGGGLVHGKERAVTQWQLCCMSH